MKIGFVLDDTLDSTDGVQQYVLTLGEWLTNNGHEVHYIVGQTSRKDLQNLHSIAKNIKVTFNKNKLSIPLPANSKRIRDLLSEQKFDVLHVQVPYSPQMAAKVVLNAPKTTAIIGTFHILPFSNKERFATKALAKLVSSSKRKFHAFIAVSEPAKEFARKTFAIDCSVIPNPTKFENIVANKTQSGTIEIVFLGRLVERKGVLYLLEAFDQLLQRYPKKPLHLSIGGTGPLFDKLNQQVTSRGLQEHVSVLGYVKEDQKRQLLSQANVAVFPSTGGESFGIVLIEAMSAGAGVVLGGDNLGYRSVLEHDETLFDPRDTVEFMERMEYFINELSQVDVFHKIQADLVKQYDVNKVAPQVIAVYKTEIAKLRQTNHNK